MKPTPEQIVIAAKNTHKANCECCKKQTGAVAGRDYLDALSRLYGLRVASSNCKQVTGGSDT